MVATEIGAHRPASDGAVAWAPGLILRDIARGGLAGLIVGIVVGGLGGRLVMRAIALLLPDSTGAFTENGNRIGDITLGGTFALLIFGGLFVAIFVAVLWVVIRPWLPGHLGLRVLAAIPVAIGLGTFGLVEGSNPDFIVLRFDPRVVAILIALVGLVGAAMAVVDAWLDRRLPMATSATGTASGVYIVIALIGTLFAVGVVATFLDAKLRPVGIALLVTGASTLAWWYIRARGAERPPRILRVIGAGSVVAAVAIGLAIELPHLRLALGIF